MNDAILIIDDEQNFLDSVKRGLASSGFRNLTLESDPRRALEFLQQGKSFDLALIDISMPGMDGISLLENIKYHSPNTECLIITALNEARTAVESLKKGAYDYLTKPLSRDELVAAVHRALERKRFIEALSISKKTRIPRLTNKEAFDDITTCSAKMLRLMKEAELHARSNAPVLITGESGTGKELLARAIHRASPRAGLPFTSINMACLTGGRFDAEFFGHTRGAFTGAEKERQGFLANTHKGSLFLDEIGDLPLDFQGRLLRVLQEGEYMKLGSSRIQRVDIRFIAATNVDLERLVSRGRFRKDLYYRLNGAWLHLPPLKERREDIPLLISTFLRESGSQSPRASIEEEALIRLKAYDYPGNIRELRSILQSALNLADGNPVKARHLPDSVRKHKPAAGQGLSQQAKAALPVIPLADMEKHYILKAYESTGDNKMQAAKLLGIGLNTLRRKLASYGVS